MPGVDDSSVSPLLAIFNPVYLANHLQNEFKRLWQAFSAWPGFV